VQYEHISNEWITIIEVHFDPEANKVYSSNAFAILEKYLIYYLAIGGWSNQLRVLKGNRILSSYL